MAKTRIKRNDQVVVISGTERGVRGRVLQVLHDKQRVIVEGAKMIKRHTRKSQAHPQGASVEREGTIHLSNVMKADLYDARRSRRGGATTPAEGS
jgi:large subunit ribosomal protein L24